MWFYIAWSYWVTEKEQKQKTQRKDPTKFAH